MVIRHPADAAAVIYPSARHVQENVRKLIRAKHAKQRVLLLLDRSPAPLDRGELEKKFRQWNPVRRGHPPKGGYLPFRVLYVHKDDEPSDPALHFVLVRPWAQ